MAGKRKGIYFDGKDRISCHVKKVGDKHTRIVLDDGTERLVDSKSVAVEEEINKDVPERMIPTIPLEAFYRPLRELEGSKQEQFQILHDLLNKRHGPKGAAFLAELFRRSVRHSDFYSNIPETFYPARKGRVATESPFADDLVEKLRKNKSIQIGIQKLEYVDYEIFPFRTTLGCGESGKAATHAGSGGMDLLLGSDVNGVLPGVGEVKAATEQVGPTFALVQSLMYSAQLATHAQFLRLKKHYPGWFGGINADQPKVDVIVFLEVDKRLNQQDLQYALSLTHDVGSFLASHIRHISFLSCRIEGDAISCEVVKPD
jgi:hypothetical protein